MPLNKNFDQKAEAAGKNLGVQQPSTQQDSIDHMEIRAEDMQPGHRRCTQLTAELRPTAQL
jgi:hypothetical protein